MQPTTLHMHTAHRIAPVDPRIFGGFIEHMGRCVYEGVYQPDSRHADEHGCRKDVLGALADLKMTTIRYPGGNFASGYHWQDGVGPRDKRPVVMDIAWGNLESNQFGTDEFIALCRRMNWAPMITINVGTGTPEEARNWVEYCNAPAGSKYADMRVANGHKEPYGVKLWCLGNEMDGAWQIGHLPAEQYAILAQQSAKMMHDVDESIELIVGGSCGFRGGSYGKWDSTVLDHVGDLAHYIAIHRYVGNRADDTPNFLAMTKAIDQQIDEVNAMCIASQARRNSRHRAYISFDEWNVWYRKPGVRHPGTFAPHLLEEEYNLEDALMVAGFLQSFIRHADCLKMANLAQAVNVIAPLLTRGDEMLVQSIYHPFAMMTKRREGESLRVVVDGPTYEAKDYGSTKYIDASAILGNDVMHVFITNRSTTKSAEVQIAPADRPVKSLLNGELLTGPDAKAGNTYEKQDVVTAKPFEAVKLADGVATMTLPPLSFAAITLAL